MPATSQAGSDGGRQRAIASDWTHSSERHVLATERTLRVVRGLGALFCVIQFAIVPSPYAFMATLEVRLLLGAAGAAILLLTNVASAAVARRGSLAEIRRRAALAFAIDTTVVLAATILYAGPEHREIWALLIIPIVEAATLYERGGAFWGWAATIPVLVALDGFLAPPATSAFVIPAISYHAGILVLVAGAAGGLAHQQGQARREAEAGLVEADRRGNLLRTVAVAGRSLVHASAADVVAATVDAAGEIGFDAASVCLYDDDGSYEVVCAHGLPDDYPGRYPRGTGIAGEVFRVRRTIVRDHYSEWAGAIERLRGENLDAVVAVPVWSGGRIAATLVAGRRTSSVQPHEVESLELLANHVATALTNAQRFAERQQFEVQLQHAAHHDPLTGLANRRLFLERLQHALARRDATVAVLFCDLDSFKNANDTLGHDVGDEILVAVARRVTHVLRPEDTIARFGGDEFTVLIEDVDDASHALLIADRINEALDQPFDIGDRRLFLSGSIGIAIASPGDDRERDLLREADIAMYRAKAAGRGRAVVFAPEFDSEMRTRLRLETALRSAVSGNELAVYYQPVLRIGSRDGVANLEALVRWHHEGTSILPSVFMPVAEETGLVREIGRYVLSTACRHLGEWSRATSTDTAPLGVSVNLSARELHDPELVSTVRGVLAEAGISPARLTLELTESAVVEDPASAREVLTTLHDLGVRLALDDFGTGYSSLSYLRMFPFDVLKIDRSFISTLDEDARAGELVRAMVALAHSLDIQVVAEGVETSAQLSAVRALGCDYVQGYRISKPRPAVDIPGLLALLQPQTGETSGASRSAPRLLNERG